MEWSRRLIHFSHLSSLNQHHRYFCSRHTFSYACAYPPAGCLSFPTPVSAGCRSSSCQPRTLPLPFSLSLCPSPSPKNVHPLSRICARLPLAAAPSPQSAFRFALPSPSARIALQRLLPSLLPRTPLPTYLHNLHHAHAAPHRQLIPHIPDLPTLPACAPGRTIPYAFSVQLTSPLYNSTTRCR